MRFLRPILPGDLRSSYITSPSRGRRGSPPGEAPLPPIREPAREVSFSFTFVWDCRTSLCHLAEQGLSGREGQAFQSGFASVGLSSDRDGFSTGWLCLVTDIGDCLFLPSFRYSFTIDFCHYRLYRSWIPVFPTLYSNRSFVFFFFPGWAGRIIADGYIVQWQATVPVVPPVRPLPWLSSEGRSRQGDTPLHHSV